MKIKTILKNRWVLSALAALSLWGVVKAGVLVTDGTNVNNLVIDGTGIYDSNGTLRYTPGSTNALTGNATLSGNLTISAPSKLYYGSASSIVSATTTALSSQGDIFTAYLAAGTNFPAAIEGSVLCSTDVALGVGLAVTVCNASVNLPQVVGVAAAAASTGTLVNVYTNGWVLALTTGTVRAGQQLVTANLSSGCSGYFQAVGESAVIVSTNAAATALQAGTAAGGLTRVRLR